MAAELEGGAARQQAFEAGNDQPTSERPNLTLIAGGAKEQDADHLTSRLETIRAQMKDLRAQKGGPESQLSDADRKKMSELLKSYRILAEAKYKSEFIAREGEANAAKILAQGEENARMMETLDEEMETIKNETFLEKELREARSMSYDDMREHEAAQKRKIIEHNARIGSEHAAANKKQHPTVEDLIREHNALALRGDTLTDEEQTRMETIKKAVAVFKKDHDEREALQNLTMPEPEAPPERYTLGEKNKPLARTSEQIRTNEIAIQQIQDEIAVLKQKNGGFFGRFGRKKRQDRIAFLEKSITNMRNRIGSLRGDVTKRISEDARMADLSQKDFGKVIDMRIEAQKRDNKQMGLRRKKGSVRTDESTPGRKAA